MERNKSTLASTMLTDTVIPQHELIKLIKTRLKYNWLECAKELIASYAAEIQEAHTRREIAGWICDKPIEGNEKVVKVEFTLKEYNALQKFAEEKKQNANTTHKRK